MFNVLEGQTHSAWSIMIWALHCECLSTARLTIREDATIVSSHERIRKRHANHVEHLRYENSCGMCM
jgi:hypothetical protein